MGSSLRAYVAEFIGTFGFVLAGAGSVCVDALMPGRLGLTGIALAHGLALAVMIYTFGPASGGHFNPAVTAVMLLHRRIGNVSAIIYVALQLLGAALAGLLLSSMLKFRPELIVSAPYLGACDLTGVGFRMGTLLEAIGTFFVVSAIYATMLDKKGSPLIGPLAIGSSFAFSLLIFGPLTGSAFNPARSFGPAIVSQHWSHWYVYWIGPLVGAATASMLQEKIFLDPN
ncbi:MAG: aquaporin [Elusimicrobia bacterium]|nr:aquaporin [Elusimicrobiota bacterium]